MPFPTTILERIVQAFRNGAWEDVTPYVYERDPILITRGAGGEKSQTQPARMTFTLDNRDSRWSPRDPDSPWAGTIRRNLLVACSTRIGECFLLLGGAAANYLSTPDSAGLSITSDLDVRLDVTLLRWRYRRTDLAGKYGAAGQRSWGLELLDDGRLRFTWSADGTNITQVSSSIPVPWPQRDRATVRVAFDVNNGLGGYSVTFYVSTTPGVAGPWGQLGDPVVTTAGTTSIFDSTAALFVGAVNSTSTGVQEGRLHAAEVRAGIDGAVRATPNVRAQARGTTSFSDGTNTWTVGGGASVTNFRTEFVGEIPEFPVERDKSGTDVYVTTLAQGITRRLGQGQPALASTLRRTLPTIGAPLRAYWPLEDGQGAESAAAAVGRFPMKWGAPGPSLAGFDGFPGSGAVPTMNGAAVRGIVAPYTSSGSTQVRLLLAIPAGGAANNAVIARITTSGTAAAWDLIYTTGGALTLTAYDSLGTSLGSYGPIAFAVDGKLLSVSVQLVQSGANVNREVAIVAAGAVSGSTGGVVSLASRTVGVVKAVILNPGGLLTDTAIGHVTVESQVTSIFTFGRPLAGWAGETAGRRAERLCAEAGITFLPKGDLDDTEPMGPQRQDTLLNLLRECETTDGGLLYEPRDRLGIVYRPRSAFYSPGTTVVLDGGGGAGGDLSDYRSTDDDQLTRNDVTVTRAGGSSARAVDEDGPLGTATVGIYDDTATVNITTDERLPDHASWRLNLGTIDEPRFPLVEAHLSRAALVADPGTTTAAVEADLFDGVDIANPGKGMPNTTIRELVVGRAVRLTSHEFVLGWTTQPASAFDVATFDIEAPGEPARYSSEGSTVNGVHTAVTGTLSVATPVGSLWGHGDGDFTIAIPETGEHMLVTNVTGASSPQSFTVTRGVDGTTAKALTGGETVELARPVRWGL